ncbi:MAG: restriction endonuclease [Microcoleaceae cyanobacterium]
MNSNLLIPSYDDLFQPTLQALKSLGGSGTVQEIYDQVCEIMNLSNEQQAMSYKNRPQTLLTDRLSWARTYLKKYGAIENVSRGVWVLTQKGKQLKEVDKIEITHFVRQNGKPQVINLNHEFSEVIEIENSEILENSCKDNVIPVDSDIWIEQLLTTLQKISPDAFERLCQQILRESGFVKVEVTGRKGDGGIDGIGVLKIALLSFQVFFQCKGYMGSVSAPEIRDFRGAMVGRTDKGLFITTGTFTRAAQQEATRDGAPVLDLIDGEQLCQILKDLQLGIETKTIEVVEIKQSWFHQL